MPIYDLMPGESARELPFYTMRFLHGRTLSQAVGAYHARRLGGSAGPLELSTLLNAFVSACQTVAYAHSRGIIHRDLKGENIELGEFGEVIVLDWGFAKILGESAGSPAEEDPADDNSSALRTQWGQVLGTPAYMAPEQASGHSERVDERTDVYGLGAILYEIITGRPPFEGRCTQEVLRKVRDGCPAQPETVASGVPPALAAICMRALARDPAERYPVAAELGREVQRWLADEPVSVFPGTLVSRLLRQARHHRPVVTGLATLLVVSAAALLLGTFLLQQERTRAGGILLEAALDEVQSAGRASRSANLQLYFHSVALAERELSAHNLNRATQLLEDCPRELREWEWRCLKRLCYSDQLTLAGHDGAVAALAFDPIAPRLASAGHDHTVRIWNVETGTPLRVLRGHTNVIYSLAYSPDGRKLATASWDGTARIWDTQSGLELLSFRGHVNPVQRVAFSPDGTRVASLSRRRGQDLGFRER